MSSSGNCMNDGIGRMSRAVARRVRDILGLQEVPSAVQARLGPAKGIWLLDVTDTVGDDIWIETFPSQRKWEGDFETDLEQRTLEIIDHAKELTSAGLNLQLMPVLEDRARDTSLLKEVLARRIREDLDTEFKAQKEALGNPLLFRQWIQEHQGGAARADRVMHGQVPYLGGLPNSKLETANFLIDSGFDPMKLQYLNNQAFVFQQQRCDVLKNKMNVRIR